MMELLSESCFKRFTFVLPKKYIPLLKSEGLFNKNMINSSFLEEQKIIEIGLYENSSEVFVVIDTEVSFEYFSFYNQGYPSRDELTWTILTYPFTRDSKSEKGRFLERIYELDQRNRYLPELGQIKKKPGSDIKRYVKSLELRHDHSLIQKYKEVHDIGNTWPEIGQGMKEVGIVDMDIYLNDFTAYMIMDTRSDFNHEKDMLLLAGKPGQKEWENYVSQFQNTSPDSLAKEKWVGLTPLFNSKLVE